MPGSANVEVVRRAFESYLWRSPSLELLHPDVEYDTTLRPDGKVWHGREGVRASIEEWTSTWDGWEMEVERYIDAGENRVVVLWHERGRARASGVQLSEAGVTVVTLKDGLIVAMKVGLDRARTLGALGLST
jgi:ketosteroid isomerase-like protein